MATTINQQDLEVRLRRISCCIATKTNDLLNKIKIGAKDVDCKLNDLLVLQRMLKYVKCYRTEDMEVLATGNVEITAIAVGDVGDILINGESIMGGPVTSATSNPVTAMTSLVTIINNAQDTYTAEFVGEIKVDGAIVITGTCENDVMTVTLTGNPDSEFIAEGLSGGSCSLNCLTEAQVLSMIDYMATKCKSCFQHIGYDYE